MAATGTSTVGTLLNTNCKAAQFIQAELATRIGPGAREVGAARVVSAAARGEHGERADA